MNNISIYVQKYVALLRSIPAWLSSIEVGKGNAALCFPIRDQIIFAKRLAMMLHSGMPILTSLRMLADEAHSKSVGRIASSLADDVARGTALSIALQKFEKTVGEFYISIIKVGETSGTLPENLEYIAQELKKKNDLKKQVVGALVYPCVIVVSTLGITTMLIVYIFPKIMPIFLSLHATLPWSTRALIFLSHFLAVYGVWLLFGIVAISFGFSFAMRVTRFHFIVDHTLLRTPVFGRLVQYYNLANTCRTLSLLLKSDVRFVAALGIASDSLKNQAYKQALTKVSDGVLRGQRLSVQLKDYPRLFPPLLVQMLSVGEATGNLSGTLMYMSEMYESEIRDWTKNLTSVLEPVLMLTMGLLVGFIAISIITPIYGITQNLSK
jgi:type IV pilus assembly protein PilC